MQTPPEFASIPKEDRIAWLEGNAGAFRVRDRSEDDGNDCGGSTEQDDDDDDHNEDRAAADRARKKARLDALSGRVSEATSRPAPAPVKQVKLSAEELVKIRDALGSQGELKGAGEALASIKRLEAHPMTLADLKATKIGVAVNRYRKHSSALVATQVANMVKDWKSLLPAKK